MMFHVKHGIKLKYPLVLVHGAGFRDKIFGINYWGRIPRYLAQEGVTVHYGGTDAWGSIESNGELLKQTILAVLAKTGAEKVNILAHSRGGLEARYVINALGLENAVASLTTMSTPHRGARVMNIALKFPLWLYRFASVFVDLWSALMGDKNPDFFRSSRQLAESYCSVFNRDYPNKDGIYYQSYTSVLRFFFSDLMYLFTWILVRIFDGPNDGLCPQESAKWGDFRGTVTSRWLFGVSHDSILDSRRFPFRGIRVIPPPNRSNGSDESGLPVEQRAPLKVPELYVSIVRELAEKGF